MEYQEKDIISLLEKLENGKMGISSDYFNTLQYEMFKGNLLLFATLIASGDAGETYTEYFSKRGMAILEASDPTKVAEIDNKVIELKELAKKVIEEDKKQGDIAGLMTEFEEKIKSIMVFR